MPIQKQHPVPLRLLLVLSLLVACASPGPYRTSTDLAHPENQVVEHLDANTDLAFVELDSQGWLWYQNRSQLNAAEDLILKDSNPNDINSPAKGVIVVAFVHGWKNNGDFNNANVSSFRDTLQEISKVEGKEPPAARRKVVGIYIGWPGLDMNAAGMSTNKVLSAAGDLIDHLSFYSRKDTADKVGNYNGVTEVLTRLEGLHLIINKALEDAHPNDRSYHKSRLVIVGHSFGAQVVFDALSQILTEHLVEHYSRVAAHVRHKTSKGQVQLLQPQAPSSDPDVTRVTPFGDLTILVNPAFEASRYYNLSRLASEISKHGGYSDSQKPVFAIFLSEGDAATRYAFPIGRFFSTMFEHYRSDQSIPPSGGFDTEGLHDFQRKTDINTVPWVDEFVDYELIPRPGTEPKVVELDLTRTDRKAAMADILSVSGEKDNLRPTPGHDIAFDPSSTILRVFGAPKTWTPFYVVRVNPEIISDHGDIWREQFRTFILEFLERSEHVPGTPAILAKQ
jgi:hypothetical protein